MHACVCMYIHTVHIVCVYACMSYVYAIYVVFVCVYNTCNPEEAWGRHQYGHYFTFHFVFAALQYDFGC